MIPRTFARYTMVTEDASLMVHAVTFEHYIWLTINGRASQTSIFKLLCSTSRIIAP